jgi:spore germination cell wall hydrolase CwlJ-like protein
MIGIDYEKAVVALVCWKQMKGENYRGMVSLASVFRNRADAGWFNGTIYNNALVFSREQNMTWDDFPDAREPQFQTLLQAMDGVFLGTLPDKTGGAMYCAHASVTDSIAGEITTKIGQYVFFRGAD